MSIALDNGANSWYFIHMATTTSTREIERTTTAFTKTEALRRIRAAKKVGANANGYDPRALTAMVGIRVLQQESILPTWTDDRAFDYIVNKPGDDLDYDNSVEYAATDKYGCARHGSIIHLYLYQREAPNSWCGQDLVDVITIWLGTPTEAPRVSVPGCRGTIEVPA